MKFVMPKQTCRRNSLGAAIKAGVVALSLAAAFPSYSQTASPPPATSAGPMRDPWVPPKARIPSTTPPVEGAELRAQVERKLKRDFDAAAGSAGTLTRAQAKAAGLGLIAQHFDEIDQNKTGTVRFEDVKRFLKKRGAQLD